MMIRRGLNPATRMQVSMGVGQTGEQTSSDSQALQDRRRSHPEAGPLTPSELELVTRSKLGPEQVLPLIPSVVFHDFLRCMVLLSTAQHKYILFPGDLSRWGNFMDGCRAGGL